jgi:hypothetical protein
MCNTNGLCLTFGLIGKIFRAAFSAPPHIPFWEFVDASTRPTWSIFPANAMAWPYTQCTHCGGIAIFNILFAVQKTFPTDVTYRLNLNRMAGSRRFKSRFIAVHKEDKIDR